MGRTSSTAPNCKALNHFTREEKWTDVKLYPDSWTMANSLAGSSGKHPWKEHEWKISDKEVWGRGISVDLPVQAKNTKIFRFHVSANQRVTLAEEDFNKVDRVIHSLDISQLFPQPPLSLPNGFMNTVAIVVGVEVMHRLSNMDFYSPRSIRLLLSAQASSSREQ